MQRVQQHSSLSITLLMGMLTTENVHSTISITLLHLVIGSIKEVKQYRINKLGLSTGYDMRHKMLQGQNFMQCSCTDLDFLYLSPCSPGQLRILFSS